MRLTAFPMTYKTPCHPELIDSEAAAKEAINEGSSA
jgi:hypothetical protein